jgi:hypothetical protein
MVRHSGSVAALRFSADEQTLVGNGNDTLVWWERASGRCIRASATEIAAGQAVATVLGEGRALQVTSDRAEDMRLWRISKHGEAQQLTGSMTP